MRSRVIKLTMFEHRTLILMCGVSGSGKSTRAAEIKTLAYDNAQACSIHSADDHFLHWIGTRDGVPVYGKDAYEYMFDAAKLSKAHNLCQLYVENSMQSAISIIIVDNTNVRVRDRKPYIALAEKYGYKVHVEKVGKTDEESLQLYAQRNIHKVSLETIRKQARRLEASNGIDNKAETTV